MQIDLNVSSFITKQRQLTAIISTISIHLLHPKWIINLQDQRKGYKILLTAYFYK